MARKKPITAEQLMAELANDPDYQRRVEELDAPRRERVKFLLKSEGPLVKALNRAGAQISSIDELVNSNDKYPELVPILLEHLDRDYPLEIRMAIARALAVPGARIGWKRLVQQFNEEPPVESSGDLNEFKWALHLAIAAAADESVLDELITLVVDRRRHGESRSVFIDALARMNDPRAAALLEELRDDPDLTSAFDRLDRKEKRRRRRAR